MENFNKNWLVIILIVIAFTAIGFLFGHMTATCHQNKMKDHLMFFRNGSQGCCSGENYTEDLMWADSLENIDVKVLVNTGNEKDTCKKVIVKKIVRELK
jgi:hypothetical protein